MFKLVQRYLLPRSWWLLVIVVFAHIIATVASLYLPSLNAEIIDKGVATGDTGKIWSLGGWMLTVSFLQIVGQAIAVIIGAFAAMRFGRDLRAALFAKVGSFSAREVQSFGAPSLITRTTNDVQQVQQLALMSLIMMVSAPITMVGGVFMAVREDAGLSWLIVVAVIVLGTGIGLIISRLGPLFSRLQVMVDTLNRVLREQLSGIRVVRAFVREPHERARFARANADITDVTTSVGRWMATLFPLVFFVMNISSIGVLWFGAQRITDGDLQVGQLTAFLAYLMQILIAVMMTSMMVVMAPRALVCAGRIQQILRTESSVAWQAEGRTDTTGVGHVEFDHVTFAYPGAEEPVLTDVSFEILPGKVTAIIGSTGAGKTTLVGLIPRLFDATSGTVRIDGVDVRDADPETLWSHIGLVPQQPYLFSGTIASNLRYGNPDATDDDLWRALEIAQARDFVESHPDGLNREMSQGGTTVSGGQRQRLAIARALVKKPDIYLFDDSFSALDVATDARVRAALLAETREAAVLIVAQRISSIRTADEILVLDHGVVVGRGSHDELLATNPTYREIVESQLSAEEAA